MIYNNSKVRRQDRLLDKADALSLLKNGEYGVLSMTDPDGDPYGIPINYVWDGADRIYLHCAPVGRKLSCIKEHAGVSFCIVGRTNVIPNKFTTSYESIIIQCHAHVNLPADKRMQALKLLLEKYSPNNLAIGMKYAEKSFHRTEIICLELKECSGKQKIIS